ncbi:MAG: DUF4340 domain-containing protein [Thermodesulfobacteriota bacterium]|nr:DUF4340 domain-containing protein [Thermodesulfobacteriota bacterium]
MKTIFKKEYILLLAVIVGLSVYLYVNDRDRVNYQLPDIPSIEKSAVDRIEITAPDSAPVILEKKDNTWRIMPKGYPAAESKISDMLDAGADLTLTALVSEASDYHRYRLDKSNAVTVAMYGTEDTLLRKFSVGKKAGSTNHTFVRLEDIAAVYHARGGLRSTFDQAVAKLRDKTVLAFAKADVQSLQIKKGDDTIVLEKKQQPPEMAGNETQADEAAASAKPKTVWETPDGRKGDAEAIDKLISRLSSLTCKSYIADRDERDFADPVYAVTVKAEKMHTLSLFAPKGPKNDEDFSDYPTVSSGAMTPFLLSKSSANQIMKDPAGLLTDDTEK